MEVMKLEGYSETMCNKHVHSTVTRSSRFHCLAEDAQRGARIEIHAPTASR